MSKMKTVEKYITCKGLCSGCGVCESQFKDKIIMSKTPKGYYRPYFKGSLSEEEWKELCYTCPSLNMNYPDIPDAKIALYGQAVECKIGWSTSADIRYKASSGGSVSSLLLFLFETNMIDGVIHVKRSENQLEAYGGLSVSSEDIKTNVGSLYMPVPLMSNVIDLLDKVEKVAIVGKGCDIRALRRLLEKHPKYKEKVVICIGILCGGTPSIEGTNRILELFGINKNNLSVFRYRGYGWPGNCTAISNDGTERIMSYNEAWGKHLGPTSSLVCKVCFDGIADSADIVFGDAWKCDASNFPSFKEADGRNLIICRTENAKKILEEMCEAGYLQVSDEIVGDDAFRLMQPSQSSRRCLAKYKIIGLRLAGYGYPKVNMHYLSLLSKKSDENVPILKKVRTIVGSIKRVLTAREV